jgi:cytidine deaminase
MPCGGCRQRILEFSCNATEVVTRAAGGAIAKFDFSALLPLTFTIEP